MKKIYFTVVLLLSSSYLFSQIPIWVVPLTIIDNTTSGDVSGPSFHTDIVESFVSSTDDTVIALQELPLETGTSVQSFLDVARISELQSLDFVLYGTVTIHDRSYEAELKLYNRESKEISKTFFVSDSKEEYSRFIETIALRINSYFNVDLGFRPEVDDVTRFDGLYLISNLGYWSFVDESWTPVIAGLFNATVGLRLVPSDPSFLIGRQATSFRFGLDISYELGTSRSDLESAFLHKLHIGLPVELFLELGGGSIRRSFAQGVHSIGLGLEPILAIDMIAQDRKYSEVFTGSTITFGGSVSLHYRYVITDAISIGLHNELTIIGYEPLQIIYSPQIQMEFLLTTLGQGESKEL